MEPPEPSRATRVGPPLLSPMPSALRLPPSSPPLPCPAEAITSANQRRHEESGDRRRKDKRVHTVQYAAVARDQPARVLGARSALQHRLGQIAGLSHEADQRPQNEAQNRGLAQSPEPGNGHGRGSGHASKESPVALRRGDVGEELALAKGCLLYT